jgi:hypothetical protein
MEICAERMHNKITIEWQFSVEYAREKLNSHYVDVNPQNKKYKKTN